MATREKEKASVQREISAVKSDLNKAIYLVGLKQFLAIVGSVIGIASLMIK